MEKDSISSLELMERAAQKAAEYLLANFSGNIFHFFCGAGNNGGDGLALARIMNQHNQRVYVNFIPTGRQTENNCSNFLKLKELGIPIQIMDSPANMIISEEGIILDCILGTGTRLPLPSLIKEIILIINRSKLPVISIDIPSGIPSDLELMTQEWLGIQADITLSFEIPKLSALVPGTGDFFGDLITLPIALNPDFILRESSPYFFTNLESILPLFRKRKKFQYKGDFGHSLIIAGSFGKAGAALLCSQACVASGSGLVSTLSPEINYPIIQTGIPEAMFISGGGFHFIEDITNLEGIQFNAIGIGPGLGKYKETQKAILSFIKSSRKPMVLDADALNILSLNKGALEYIPEGSILTPHVGEFNRIIGEPSKDPVLRISLAQKLAKNLKSIIVLKGAYTAIIFPNQEVHFNSTGNPGMATGGSGDVLTGILTGLMAQGYSSMEAAILGVYIHGRSGDIAKEKFSETSLMARDIVSSLSDAFKELELIKSSF